MNLVSNPKYFDVSYSSLGTLRSCPRKFQANKFFDHPARGDGSVAIIAGHAIHAGYQNFLIHRSRGKAMLALAMEYKLQVCWESSNDRSLEACLSTLDAMIGSDAMLDYELAQIQCPDGVTRPAIEVPFALEFEGLSLPDGRQIRFIGYIDAVMRNLLSGIFKTMDIKTHRNNMKDRTASFKWDTQQLPYGLILEHFQGKTIDSFEVLYLDAYVDVLAPRVVPYKYVKTNDDIQDWLFGKIGQLSELIRFAKADWFPRADSGCVFYNSPCKYLEICGIQNKETFQKFILGNQEAGPPRVFEPWITAKIRLPEMG